MASRAKKPPLHEIDLAVASTLPADERKRFIAAAISGHGYDRYRSSKALYRVVFNASSLLDAPPVEELKKMIERLCPKGRKGEIDGNKLIIEAASKYSEAHNVTSAVFPFEPVDLRRAGKRYFWFPLILKIDGREYIPFFDHRLNDGLTIPAMRFIFSINNGHIREQDPAKYGNMGFVIFQFEKAKDGTRIMTPYFDDKIDFWNMGQIGQMIDETYRTLDEIRRAA